MTTTRRKLGQLGEQKGVDYLRELGYEIITRNWRCQQGEVDIVARRSERYHFVEVRTRRGSRFGPASASITPTKQARMTQVAQSYLQTENINDASWQIDVLTIQLAGQTWRIDLIENAVGW